MVAVPQGSKSENPKQIHFDEIMAHKIMKKVGLDL
jgi:hypothetical protein